MTDKSTLDDAELGRRARASLRDHALPDDVQRRLRLARAAAVDSLENRDIGVSSWLNPRWVVPMGAAAAIALAAVLTQQSGPSAMPAWEEGELAAASEMDMLDDIEFLAWMIELDEDLADGS
ncbi:MAG: hypothetical protein AAF465_14565 [Pseudomonadota bacterium]